MQLPNIDVYLLDGQSDLQKISLREVCAGKSGVIDIWHTRCTRCPAALDKLHAEYQKIFMNNPKVQFVALALSQGPGNFEDVAELGPE